MKHVTFAVDVAPHRAGETRLVPDKLAEKLMNEKKISAAEPWPPRPADDTAKVARKPLRQMLRPDRPQGGGDARKAK